MPETIHVWLIEDHKTYGERLAKVSNRVEGITCPQRFVHHSGIAGSPTVRQIRPPLTLPMDSKPILTDDPSGFFGTLGSGDGKESDATHSTLPSLVEPRLSRRGLVFDFCAWGRGAFGLG
jgi:hypothetical protein